MRTSRGAHYGLASFTGIIIRPRQNGKDREVAAMESDRERGGDYKGEFLARSRVLALIVAVGSIALVVLVLVLPLTMEHTFEGA
ncbi:MAG: hypothetical protein V3W22_06555, partial [Thermoplasmata archaeon]